MGIESTRYITREQAIDRITEITDLAKKGEYYNILNICCEADYNIEDINEYIYLDYPQKWLEYLPNEELEDLIDRPFIRFSMFDKYIIDKEEN